MLRPRFFFAFRPRRQRAMRTREEAVAGSTGPPLKPSCSRVMSTLALALTELSINERPASASLVVRCHVRSPCRAGRALTRVTLRAEDRLKARRLTEPWRAKHGARRAETHPWGRIVSFTELRALLAGEFR